MPLRVTKEYSIDGEDGKKAHKKMSKNGHYQKVRRPTGLEVYNDAAKILEELLEKRIDGDVKVSGRQRRNITHPTKGTDISRHSGNEITVARCKTMPSRYRESIDDDTKKSELENLEKKEQKKRLKKGASVEVETDSSANDTELESEADETNVVTKNRKKKSLFKRAKENLIRSFRRDQKDGFGTIDDEKNNSNSKHKRKTKKSSSVVSESKRHVKGHLNEDKSIDYTEVVDFRHSKGSSNTESLSHKSRKGSMSRSSLLDTIRKPFRKSLHRRENLDDDEKNKIQNENGVRSLSIRDDSTNSCPSHLYRGAENATERERESSNSPASSVSPTNPDTLPIKGPSGTLSSTTSTTYPTSSEYNQSAGSLNILPSPQRNVLDFPGNDIKFMDDIESDEEKRRSVIKYHGSEGLLSLQWLADQTANAKAFNFQIDEHSVSKIRADGHLEMTTTVTATRTVVLPELAEAEEIDSHDGNGDNSQMKDEIYGKIAQKLIDMADTYGMSDNDARGAGADMSDAPLTDLEKEIIACLRVGGDKYGKKMDDQLDALKSAVSEEAYTRFRSTVQNSMGQELSWNTVALLFYATKGVVSAVGKSSKAAVQAKEFTLKYISDTFVSWIMEQGGFDSMLSASDTDSDLD